MTKKTILLSVFLLSSCLLYAQFEFEYGKEAKSIVLKQQKAKRYHEIDIIIKGKSFHFTSFPTLDDYNHFSNDLKYTFTNDSVLTLKYSEYYNYNSPRREKGVYTYIRRNEEYYECGLDNKSVIDEIGLRKAVKDSAGYEVSRSVFYVYDGEIARKDSSIEYERSKYDEQHRLIEKYSFYHPAVYTSPTNNNKRETWEYTGNLVKHKVYEIYGKEETFESEDYTRSYWNKDSTVNTTSFVNIHQKFDTWRVDTLTTHVYYTYNKEGNVTHIHTVSFDSWFKVTQVDMEMEVAYKKEKGL